MRSSRVAACALLGLTLAGLGPAFQTGQQTWTFDNLENIGGHRATVLGRPRVVDTPLGKAVEFDGVSDGLMFDVHPLAGAATFTWEAIFRPDGGNAEQRWFHLEETPPAGAAESNRMLFEIRVVDGRWCLDAFNRTGDASRALLNRQNLHDLGRWYHVAMVYDGREFRSYVNGVLDGAAEIRLAPQGPGRTAVGMRMNKVFYFKGAVRMARFTSRALAPAEFLPMPALTPEQKAQVDAAVPRKAPAKPRKPRRMLVTNLSMRDGRPVRGSSSAAIPTANYAFEQMGKRTGAYEPVFNNDIEIFRPDKIRQFDALCFLNTVGVLFDDPELRASLLAFIAGGKGFVGIHDAIATFVQYPKYDQWPPFGKMLGATENGGHPWDGEPMTIKIDDLKSPINAAFRGQGFEIVDQAFQFQEPVLRDHLRVLLSIDATRTPFSPRRRILPVRAADKDFPVSWIRSYEKGRVFYSSLGHGAKVFSNPALLEHFLAGIQYALGDLKADSTPSARLRSAK